MGAQSLSGQVFLKNLESVADEEDSGELDFPWSDEECRDMVQ